jgi:hypothetical protein
VDVERRSNVSRPVDVKKASEKVERPSGIDVRVSLKLR